ncbi:MAG TPA: D-alanyl-D-alanine carboxypeptidase/D-alanyl-D-alanine-endopeptidase [Prolixibacteraceae bacterium]|nr:D-alanyl-D-alanine carboxypeptidase/D-alanyl-D-alanine-endopeptidase [Prolixibacteraceae bacterium]
MRNLTLFLLLFFVVEVFAQPKDDKLMGVIRTQHFFKNAGISICVSDVLSDSVLWSYQPELCMVPASVQKLITSATALEVFGADMRFETVVWFNGTIESRKLSGDLVVTGGGDPTLGSGFFCKQGEQQDFFAQWVHRFRQAGIDTITGDIVVDPFIFSDNDVPQSWLYEDVGNHFGAAATGLAIFDNVFCMEFNVPDTPGQPAILAKVFPDIPNLSIDNKVFSSSINSDQAYVFGSTFNSDRLVKGTLPAGAKGFVVKASMPDPAVVLANQLLRVLTDSSVVFLGKIEQRKVADIQQIEKSKVLIRQLSPALSAIIDMMNKESDNLFAETLLKHLGLKLLGDGSTLAGCKAITSYWNSKEIGKNALFVSDGSGLSRLDAFSSGTLANLLVYMKKTSAWSDTFEQSIPLAGVEGTQKSYFQQSPVKGRIRAKTGSMTRVRSMAGYMLTQRGHNVAFSVLLNNYSGSGSTVKKEIEKIVELIYSEL